MAANGGGLGPVGGPPGASPVPLRTAASWVIVAAGSWWLLGQLAVVLRPLLLAVFLGYVLMPYYGRLRRRLPAPAAIALLVGATTGVLVGVLFAVYRSLAALAGELPQVQDRAFDLLHRATEWAAGLPVVGPAVGSARLGDDQEVLRRLADQAAVGVFRAVPEAAAAVVEAGVVGLYLLFLLADAGRFPARVRAAFPPARAERILDVFGRINSAIVSYLLAKVRSSLVIAVPVGGVLALFEVRFALLWAVLTFLCNFIPYLGSVVAYSLPAAFAFVQYDFGWRPLTVAGLLLGWHLFTAAVVEPTILGRAVGLSPLVILTALAVWGLLWGLPGMFLAVPLTVVLKIVFENVAATRPVAELMSG